MLDGRVNGWAVLLSAVFASGAQANCAQDQQRFSSCQIEDQNTEVFVCFDEERATYSYGPVDGPPEIYLSEAIETLEFEPWSGVTRETGESVTFYNGNYSYEVVGGFERLIPSDAYLDENGDYDARTRHYGWIAVELNGEPLLRLGCISETVRYAFGGGIYDLKVAAGQVWNDRLRSWEPGRN